MQTAQRLTQLKPSYIRNILKAASTPGMLSVAGGLPAAELFPMELLADSMSSASKQARSFQYAATEGDMGLRNWIAAGFEDYDEDNILITTGSQQGLDLIVRAYLDPKDTVLLEAPCYLGALQIFNLAQTDIHTVSQDDEGPDLQQLERQITAHKPKIFYAVPDFHNPTGLRWSLARRQQVAALLDKHQVTLVEDAPYRELYFTEQALPTVSSLCQRPSFLLGSFSKIAAPGVRIGYVASEPNNLAPLIQVKQASDLHSSMPMQVMLNDMVRDTRFNDHLINIRRNYQHRQQALSHALEPLGELCHYTAVEGGMFLWLQLNQHNARQITELGMEQGVAVVPGDVFWPGGETNQQALRLNFSYLNEADLSEAAARLTKAFALAT